MLRGLRINGDEVVDDAGEEALVVAPFPFQFIGIPLSSKAEMILQAVQPTKMIHRSDDVFDETIQGFFKNLSDLCRFDFYEICNFLVQKHLEKWKKGNLSCFHVIESHDCLNKRTHEASFSFH